MGMRVLAFGITAELAATGCGFPRLPALVTGDVGVDAPADVSQNPDALSMPAVSSCQGLPATCGPARNDNCCSSLPVPAGTYFRSYDTAGDGGSGDQGWPASVSDFRLDKYAVTVGRFRAFVMAGKGTRSSPPAAGDGAHAQISGSGWDAGWNVSLVADQATLITALRCDTGFSTWGVAPEADNTLPINCVTWYEMEGIYQQRQSGTTQLRVAVAAKGSAHTPGVTCRRMTRGRATNAERMATRRRAK
jgi:formylglycine-generating enzyme required for sulfatase activity